MNRKGGPKAALAKQWIDANVCLIKLELEAQAKLHHARASSP